MLFCLVLFNVKQEVLGHVHAEQAKMPELLIISTVLKPPALSDTEKCDIKTFVSMTLRNLQAQIFMPTLKRINSLKRIKTGCFKHWFCVDERQIDRRISTICDINCFM